MSYIDVLIPGIIGLLLVTLARLFTKAEGEKFEKTKGTLRTIGFVLIGVAILYFVVRIVGEIIKTPPNHSLKLGGARYRH